MKVNIYRIGDHIVRLHVKGQVPVSTEKKLYLMKAAYITGITGWNISFVKNLTSLTFKQACEIYL